MNQNTTVTNEIDAEYLWGDSFTEWLEYPHPDDEGGMTTAVKPCPECIEYQVCPQCDRDMMMEYGALLICVHCGFTYDEAEITVKIM